MVNVGRLQLSVLAQPGGLWCDRLAYQAL